MKRTYISHWTIKATWDDGTEEYLPSCPDDVAVQVDEWLTAVELERNEDLGYIEKIEE